METKGLLQLLKRTPLVWGSILFLVALQMIDLSFFLALKTEIRNSSMAWLPEAPVQNSSDQKIKSSAQNSNSPSLRRASIRNSNDSPMRLVACVRLKNEAPYLRNWIEYHRMVGFDSFILMNDNSTDGTQCIMDAYAKEGIVVRMPQDTGDFGMEHKILRDNAMQNCQRYLKEQEIEAGESPRTWMLTQDTDEYVYFNQTDTDRTLKDVLRRMLKRHSTPVQSISIPNLYFGASGHDYYEPAPVIDRFDHREPYDFKKGYKSISLVATMADKCYLENEKGEKSPSKCIGVHGHTLQNPDGSTPKWNRFPDVPHITDPRYINQLETVDDMVIMHYKTKSREEFYQRTCLSSWKKKYKFGIKRFFDFQQTLASDIKDDRMTRFSGQLNKRLSEIHIADQCDATFKTDISVEVGCG